MSEMQPTDLRTERAGFSMLGLSGVPGAYRHTFGRKMAKLSEL